jgi:hypothetical protein
VSVQKLCSKIHAVGSVEDTTRWDRSETLEEIREIIVKMSGSRKKSMALVSWAALRYRFSQEGSIL